MASAAHNQLMSPQGPHFSPHSHTAKTNDKTTQSQEEWHLLV